MHRQRLEDAPDDGPHANQDHPQMATRRGFHDHTLPEDEGCAEQVEAALPMLDSATDTLPPPRHALRAAAARNDGPTPTSEGVARSPLGVGLLSHAYDVLSSPSKSTGTTKPMDESNARVGKGPKAVRTGNVPVGMLRRAVSGVTARRPTGSPSAASVGTMATMAAPLATTPVISIVRLNGKRRAQRCTMVGMARSSPMNRERHPCHDD